MTRTYLTLIALATLISCSKKSSSDDTNQPQTQDLQVVNSYYDSLYVSVENKTTPTLSVSQQKIAGQAFVNFTAKKGDNIVVKGVVKPNKKWGRHPLFLSEVAYDSSISVTANTSAIVYTAPASKAVQIRISTIGNATTKYIRGTLKYGTKEDSLMYIRPGEITGYTTIGYFKPSDIAAIDQPRIKLYTGTTTPYTEWEAGSVLWAKGGWDTFGNKVAEAPSPTAVGYTNTYQFLIQ